MSNQITRVSIESGDQKSAPKVSQNEVFDRHKISFNSLTLNMQVEKQQLFNCCLNGKQYPPLKNSSSLFNFINSQQQQLQLTAVASTQTSSSSSSSSLLNKDNNKQRLNYNLNDTMHNQSHLVSAFKQTLKQRLRDVRKDRMSPWLLKANATCAFVVIALLALTLDLFILDFRLLLAHQTQQLTVNLNINNNDNDYQRQQRGYNSKQSTSINDNNESLQQIAAAILSKSAINNLRPVSVSFAAVSASPAPEPKRPPMNGSIFGKRSLGRKLSTTSSADLNKVQSKTTQKKRITSTLKSLTTSGDETKVMLNKQHDWQTMKSQRVKYGDLITNAIENFLAANEEDDKETVTISFCRMIVYECNQVLKIARRNY